MWEIVFAEMSSLRIIRGISNKQALTLKRHDTGSLIGPGILFLSMALSVCFGLLVSGSVLPLH